MAVQKSGIAMQNAIGKSDPKNDTLSGHPVPN